MQLVRLFQPGRLGGLELKNRLVMPAMGTPLASPDGQVTSRMIDYYVERAKGGVGLIVTQFSCISPDSGPTRSLCIYDDKFIPGLRELAAAVHEHGAKIAVQTCHLGTIMEQMGHPKDAKIAVPSMLPWMEEKGCFK